MCASVPQQLKLEQHRNHASPRPVPSGNNDDNIDAGCIRQ